MSDHDIHNEACGCCPMPEPVTSPAEAVWSIPQVEIERMLAEDAEEDMAIFREVFPASLATLLNSSDE